MKISARLTNFKGCFGMIWHFMTPSPTALPEPALWAGYEFLKEQTIKIHFRGDSCRNNMVFNLESTLIENISAFPYTAICDCIFAFLDHIWHIRHHWYIRCNPKTYAIRFSVWQAIFGPNFRLIDQHLVLVWADLHLFLAIFTTIFGWNIFLFRDVMLQMRLKYPY